MESSSQLEFSRPSQVKLRNRNETLRKRPSGDAQPHSLLYETSGNIAFFSEVVQLAAGSTELVGKYLMPSILDKRIRFAYDISRCSLFLSMISKFPHSKPKVG